MAGQQSYELMIIIKPHLSEEARAELQKRLTKEVANLKGEIKQTDVWGKKHLAYDIEGFNEGYYVVYQLDLPKAAVAELNEYLRLNTDVIRYLVSIVD